MNLLAYGDKLIGDPNGGGGGGGTYSISILASSSELYGKTIVVSVGGEPISELTFSSSGTASFSTDNVASYTFSVTIAGITYSSTVNVQEGISTYSTTIVYYPNGRTITPINDVETWLACARITDTGYTTLNEVLADSTTLMLVITNNNATDYLVRSTDFTTGICGSTNAMSYIGSSDYATNTLTSDSTWNPAIQNSAYFESVDNVKVPVMTSDTTPSGTVIYSSQTSDQPAYRVFDNITSGDSNKWRANGVDPQWIGYDFERSVKILKVRLTNRDGTNTYAPQNFTLQGSHDNSTWESVASFTNSNSSQKAVTNYSAVTQYDYRYWRIYITSNYNSNSSPMINELQFYGREAGGVQTFLQAAGITDKLYTNITQLLSDTTTLTQVLASEAAVDYLVTCTAWIDDFTNSETAMTCIGLNNYAANTLLADSAWGSAILLSTYKEGVLNVKVPTMSSNTTPEGECSCNHIRSDGRTYAYQGFDNNDATYIEYDRENPISEASRVMMASYTFPSSKKILSVLINYNVYSGQGGSITIPTLVVQGCVTDGSWMTLKSVNNPSASYNKYLLLEDNIDYYDSYRIVFTVSNWYNDMARVNTLQFYGREDV